MTDDSAFLDSIVLIIGLGSMGKRRIRNLKYLGMKYIQGYDIRPDRNQEANLEQGIDTFNSFEEAIKRKPDIIIISTPPDEHIEYAMWAAENHVPFFVEASVVNDGISELIQLCKKNNVTGIPSCTPRFHPSIRKMKKIVESGNLGKLLSFTHHYGSCYTDWHPWEDYREVYFSNPETGAGRESVTFELEWIQWLFGEFCNVSCFSSKRLDTEPIIEDTYQIVTKDEDGILGNIMIDVTSPYYFRETKGIFSQGVMMWNWRDKKVVIYNKKDDSLEQYTEPEPITADGYKFEENMYIEEMCYFLSVLQGKRSVIYYLEDDLKVLNLLKKVEESNNKGSSINVT